MGDKDADLVFIYLLLIPQFWADRCYLWSGALGARPGVALGPLLLQV